MFFACSTWDATILHGTSHNNNEKQDRNKPDLSDTVVKIKDKDW